MLGAYAAHLPVFTGAFELQVLFIDSELQERPGPVAGLIHALCCHDIMAPDQTAQPYAWRWQCQEARDVLRHAVRTVCGHMSMHASPHHDACQPPHSGSAEFRPESGILARIRTLHGNRLIDRSARAEVLAPGPAPRGPRTCRGALILAGVEA